MFGRKKKKEEEDPLGLSTIGSTASVVPAGPPTPAAPDAAGTPGAGPAPTSNQLTPTPLTPTPLAPTGPAPTPGQPVTQVFTSPNAVFKVTTSQTPMVFTSGMPFGAGAMLKQMLGGQGPISDLIKEIQANPQAFREKMIAQMQAAGVSGMVVTPQGYQQVGATPSGEAPTHVDVIDELTKAADLHDKGALTDAEFEALKHKLLGH